jgi:hypothetical protein
MEFPCDSFLTQGLLLSGGLQYFGDPPLESFTELGYVIYCQWAFVESIPLHVERSSPRAWRSRWMRS